MNIYFLCLFDINEINFSGSIRPIRGIGYSTLSVSVVLHWDGIGTKHNIESVHEEEVIYLIQIFDFPSFEILLPF